MNSSAHLWAVDYDDANRARQAQEAITSLGGPERSIKLLEIAVLACLPDRSFLFNGKPFLTGNQIVRHGALGLLAGFALAVPLLTEDAVARLYDSTAPNASDALGINEKFKQDIASLLRPGRSALLVLGVAEDLTATLIRLRGLGGTILRTNVNVELASLIQSTLAAKMSSI